MKYSYNYISIRGKWFPIIPLLVGKNENWVPVSALIDSGAVISLFNAGVARALGIRPKDGKVYQPTGISGTILAYIHDVKLRIETEEIKVRVAFTDQLAVPLNLLGREDFF